MTSRSFRAVLPHLGEEELQRLRRWGADNCSASCVFREGEAVIWLASEIKLAVVRPSSGPCALHCGASAWTSPGFVGAG